MDHAGTKTRKQPAFDVVIVGAGAAGVGLGATLRDLGLSNFTLLERHEVGASFRQWPHQMRFISPSFPSNGFGLVDLNAVTYTTSPGFMLQTEHPSGAEFADYLQAVAAHYQLPVQSGIDVGAVVPVDSRGNPCKPKDARGFELQTTAGPIGCRFIVWAAGEFQYPNLELFPGSERCRHNATVDDWGSLEGSEFLVIGGYESGIDAAVQLGRMGKQVRVLDDFAPWGARAPDPSLVLSPYTRQRLAEVYEAGNIELIEAAVERVEKKGSGFRIYLQNRSPLESATQPILATGFSSSLVLIEDLLEWHPRQHHPLLSSEDESVATPGLFLAGPFVRHGNLIFCFIYKFRQRFAVVANAIGQRLGIDTSPLERYRLFSFYLDDLSCCDDCLIC